MKIEGYVEITLAKPERHHTCQQLIAAIRRTRLTLDDKVMVDITTPALSDREATIIIGASELPWTPKANGLGQAFAGPRPHGDIN